MGACGILRPVSDAALVLARLIDHACTDLDVGNAEGDPEGLEDLGVRAYNAGCLAAAKRYYGWAIDRAPSERLRLRLAATHLRMGRLHDVVTDLRPWLDDDETGYVHLHVGNALRYRGNRAEAGRLLDLARTTAERRRDAPLAVAAGCAEGELLLDRREPKRAVAAFGKALGITELTPDDAITVAPLAGLAEAHAAWRAPQKAVRLAQRAVERARASGRGGSLARASLALARATRHDEDIRAAIDAARAAPHVPLWIRAYALAVTDAVAPGPEHLSARTVAEVATCVGMHREAEIIAGEDAP